MTERNAMKIIRDLQFKCSLLFDTATSKAKEQIDREYQALNLACVALEKQIPKKPRKTTEDEEKNYYCSECKYYLGDEVEIQLCMPRPIYCPDCGQALDWSEEE